MKTKLKALLLNCIVLILIASIFCSKESGDSSLKEPMKTIIVDDGIKKYNIPIERHHFFLNDELYKLREEINLKYNQKPKKGEWEKSEEFEARLIDSLRLINANIEKTVIDKYGDILIKVSHDYSLPGLRKYWYLGSNETVVYYSLPFSESYSRDHYNYYYIMNCISKIKIDTLIYDPDREYASLKSIENIPDLSPVESDQYVDSHGWGLKPKPNCYNRGFDWKGSTRVYTYSFGINNLPRNKAKKLYELVELGKIYAELNYHYKMGYLLKYYSFRGDYIDRYVAASYYDNIFEINGPYDDFCYIKIDSTRLYRISYVSNKNYQGEWLYQIKPLDISILE